jgi:hypothetical protein
MDALTTLVSDPWYGVVCEAHHALLGSLSALVLLAGYFLISLTTAYFCRGGRRISPFSWSGAVSLGALSFGTGLILHYAADFGFLGNWWKW